MQVSRIPQYTPQMKVVCISDIVTPANQLVDELLTQNAVDASFKYIRDYNITTPRRTYRNMIVSCSLDLLKRFIADGLLIRGAKYRCYEHIRTLQCFRCYDYGHMANKCPNDVICRKCSGKHVSTECTDASGKLTCINCKIAGRNFNHSVTADNCPRRIERINGLIDFLVRKTEA